MWRWGRRLNSGKGEEGIKEGYLAEKALPQIAMLGKNIHPILQHDKIKIRNHCTLSVLIRGEEALRGIEMHGMVTGIKTQRA